MGEVWLAWGEKALEGPADEWFPWLKRQPDHIRAELQQLVRRAEDMTAEWAVTREGLGNELRRLADDTSAPRDEVEALTDGIRGALAGPEDPEKVAGFAAAGRVSLGERVRVYVMEGVRPRDIRAEEAISGVRAGTERLRASLEEMRGLAERVEEARKGWTAQAPAAERRSEPVGRVMGDHPQSARSGGGRRPAPDTAPSSGVRDRKRGRGPRGGSRSA